MNKINHYISLEECCEFIRNGASISQKPDSGGIPITRIETISKGGINNNKFGYAGIVDGSKYNKYFLVRGDILVSHINSESHLGKSSIYGGTPSPLIHGMNLLCLRPRSNVILPEYLHYFIKSGFFKRQLPKITNKSVNQASFKVSEFKTKIKVPMMSIGNQQKAVELLDKANLIRQKRTASTELLDSYINSVFLEMFGDIKARKSLHTWGSIRPFVKAQSGKSSKDVLSSYITEYPVYGGNGINGWSTKPLYNEPVVIAGRVGQQCGVIHTSEGPSWVTDNAIVIQIKDDNALNIVYLADALKHSNLRHTVQHLDLPFINQSIILDTAVPLPDINLQNKYSRIVRKVRETKLKMIKQEKELENQLQSIMQDTFN